MANISALGKTYLLKPSTKVACISEKENVLGSSEEVREDFLEEVGSDQGVEIILNWDGRKLSGRGWDSTEEVMTRRWSWKVRTFWKEEEHMTCIDLGALVKHWGSVMLMMNLEGAGGEQSRQDPVVVPVRDGVMPARAGQKERTGGQAEEASRRPTGNGRTGITTRNVRCLFSPQGGMWSAHTD